MLAVFTYSVTTGPGQGIAPAKTQKFFLSLI
jgi:hypothetical protein